MCVIDWAEVRQWLQALAVPSVALLAAWIAYRQWRTNALKIKLDLYDRRLRIFEELREFLSKIARDGAIDMRDASIFRSRTMDATFLFGQDVDDYLDRVFRSALDLGLYNTRHRAHLEGSGDPNYDHADNVEKMGAALTWLTEQFEPARDLFGRYLRIIDVD